MPGASWMAKSRLARSNCLTDSLPRPKALLIDLDGTILADGCRISGRSVDAIRAADQVIPVAIATGRVFEETCHYARFLGLRTPQIADNGARLADPLRGRTVHELPMPMASTKTLVRQLEAENIPYIACDQGRTVRNGVGFQSWHVSVVIACVNSEQQALQLQRANSSTETIGIVSHADRGDWYVNFSHRDGGKGYGVRAFAAALGIDPSEVMAIGDGINDLEMFDAVGIPVAMGHAADGIKKRADYVTASISDEGVACAIDRFILNR